MILAGSGKDYRLNAREAGEIERLLGELRSIIASIERYRMIDTDRIRRVNTAVRLRITRIAYLRTHPDDRWIIENAERLGIYVP